jgi:hypothetical protein
MLLHCLLTGMLMAALLADYLSATAWLHGCCQPHPPSPQTACVTPMLFACHDMHVGLSATNSIDQATQVRLYTSATACLAKLCYCLLT